MSPGSATNDPQPDTSQQRAVAKTTVVHPMRRSHRLRRWLGAIVVLGAAIFFGREMLAGLLNEAAASALEKRQHDRASAALAVAKFLQADNAHTQFLLGVTHRRKKDFAAAGQHLQRALDLGFDEEAVRRQQLLALAQTRDFDRVEDRWDELLMSAAADGPEISEAFAELLLSRFEIDGALRVLEAWQSDFPADPGPHMMRGKILVVVRNWKDAEAEYQRAIELDPDNAEAKLQKAICQTKQLKHEEAAAILKQLIDGGNHSADVIVNYAACLRKLQGPQVATELLQKYWTTVSDDIDALLEMGRGHMESEQPAEALTYLKQAVEKNPIDREIRYLYAQALQAAGRGDEAQQEFAYVNEATKPVLKLGQLEPALVEDPDNIELRFQIAEITFRYKSRQEGVNWLHSLLHLQPDHVPTHRLLAEHYEEIGDRERAAKHRAMSDTAEASQP